MKRIKKLIKKILLVDEGPKPLFLRNELKPISIKYKNGFKYCEFGNLNPDKTFYIIKRTSHAGIFSYLSFVLNHLIISKENNFIPIVDMENYVSPYNEINPINGTTNSWEYYFEKVSKYEHKYNDKSNLVLYRKNNIDKNIFKDL